MRVEMEWINVKDKSPDEVNVIVSYKFGVMECKHLNGKFAIKENWEQEIPEVTHWMRLPNKVE